MSETESAPSAPLTLDDFTKYMNNHVIKQMNEVRTKLDDVTAKVISHSNDISAISGEIDQLKTADVRAV